MSVLECQRRGCDHIMCERYSYEYGYLCDSCFSELVSTGPDTNISEFMQGYPTSNREEESLVRYDYVFPHGEDE